jgi:hypothetical protein
MYGIVYQHILATLAPHDGLFDGGGIMDDVVRDLGV